MVEDKSMDTPPLFSGSINSTITTTTRPASQPSPGIPAMESAGTTTIATNPSVLSGLLLLVTGYLVWPWLYSLLMSAAALVVSGGTLLLQLPVLLAGLAGMLLSPAVGYIFFYLASCLVFLQGPQGWGGGGGVNVTFK